MDNTESWLISMPVENQKLNTINEIIKKTYGQHSMLNNRAHYFLTFAL